MRRLTALLVVLAGLTGGAAHATAPGQGGAPVRGGAYCWDFDRVGTDGPDRVEGTADAEHVMAYAGADELLLFGGDDCAATGQGDDLVHLGPGNDEAETRGGADRIFGGPGDDVLLPGVGADTADGGDGDDLIRDDRGDTDRDVLIGGPGHDVLRAANAGADVLECGPGWDVAIADPEDTLRDCDDVHLRRHPALSARAVRTGVRPVFLVRWSASEPAAEAHAIAVLVDHPATRPGCSVGSWHAGPGHGSRLRLAWRGLQSACPGVYAFRLTHVDTSRGRPAVACDRLAGAAPGGCSPTEALGVARLVVL